MLIVEYSKINIYDGCEAKEKKYPTLSNSPAGFQSLSWQKKFRGSDNEQNFFLFCDYLYMITNSLLF